MSTSFLDDDDQLKYRLLSEQFPQNNDFGFQVVGQSVERVFVLENKTNQPKTFEFDKCAFNISPSKGTLTKKIGIAITVSYTPKEATTLVGSTILRVHGEKERVIKFSIVGKFPFIKLSNNKVDFGTMLHGKHAIKEVVLKNVSEVPAKFRVEKVKDDTFEDTSFSINELAGEIPSKASFLLKISYSPMIWDLSSCTHFKIICEGGNEIIMQCSGLSLSIMRRSLTISRRLLRKTMRI